MDAFKISIKLFVENDSFGASEFVPVFHRWIQDRVLSDHLLIDVADYAHVHNGPGTLLVSHEANIHMERSGGRLGLLYLRKTLIDGTLRDRLRAIFTAALQCAAQLEQEPGFENRVRFDLREAVVTFHDRLLTPNDAATADAVLPDVQAIAAEVHRGGDAVVSRLANDSRQLLQLQVIANTTARAGELLTHLAPAAAGA